MKTALILTLLTLSLTSSPAQDTINLSGTITDIANKEKLSKAAVILRKPNDSLRLFTASDDNGNFIFRNVQAGKYDLHISYVGFTPVVQSLVISKSEVLYFELRKTNTSLANISVSSEKKLITHTTDKITYNVSESAVSASDNLYNIVLKVPGVTESNGSLFYQGKPLNILLDNKSNNLSGEDLKNYLFGVLGTNVDKLEILLNPSSRYDANGGAVFNIRSQKNKNYGLTESITLGAGTGSYLRNTAGFTINYRNRNINIYGGYDFNYQKQFFLLKAHLGFTASPATIYLVDDNIRTHNNHAVRLGIDYDLDKKTSIGLLFKGFQNYRSRAVVNNSVYSPGSNIMDTVVEVITNTNALFKSPSLNLFLKTTLSSKGAELTVNADYFGYHKKWDEDITNAYTDKLGNSTASPDYLINRSPANNSVRSITADLYHPVKKGSIEAGVKVTESKTDNNVLWQQLYSNSWQTDAGKTNHFIYKEDVFASYVNLLKNYKKLTLQAGVRLEATRSNGVSVTTNITTPNKYNDFFPSLSIQYKGFKDQQVMVNYRRSIKRFGFDIINPFIITQGPYSYHQGNPYIKPSYFNSINVAWSYKNKLLIGTGFSAVKNPMSYGYRKYGNSNSSIGTFLNFSEGKLYNSNISYTIKPFKGKWTSINSFNFLHSELPDFDSKIQHHNNYVLNTVNTILLPKKVSMELSAFYNSPLLDGTVLRADYYGASLGFSMPVLKSKGSLKISCTDIFNTQIFHNKTDGAGIRIDAYWKPESRFANILFTYRFGNLNVKANKNRSTGIEEEKSRMGNN